VYIYNLFEQFINLSKYNSYCYVTFSLRLQIIFRPVDFYRAMHLSAKRGIEIACRPSACPSVTLVDQDHIGRKSWKLHDQFV